MLLRGLWLKVSQKNGRIKEILFGQCSALPPVICSCQKRNERICTIQEKFRFCFQIRLNRLQKVTREEYTMKKIFSLFMSVALSAALLAGCAGNSNASQKESSLPETKGSSAPASSQAEVTPAPVPAEPVVIKTMALKGPTAMGMVKMMDDKDTGVLKDELYEFSIAAAVDEVTPALVQGTVDIAAVPANLASVLYNNTKGGVQVLAVNTLGVLYIVESGDTVQSISDLKGKTIYASGKGATPEYALNYILKQNGIDPVTDVTIEWKSEHAECAAALAANENAIALLPQPFVTTAQSKNEAIRVALDLTKEWDAVQGEAKSPSALITGVLVVRTAFAEEHPEAVDAFLAHYKESVAYVNGHIDEAAALIGKYDIVPEAVAKTALPACNITYIDGAEMKNKLSGYLSSLFEQEPKAVGGALPEDAFYYGS